MDFENFLRIRNLIAVAVGAGALLGTAGLVVYQLFSERKRAMLQMEVAKLSQTVAELKGEINSLRDTDFHKASRSRVRKAPSTISDADTDMYSAIDDQDEFFDFSDDDLTDQFQENEDVNPVLSELYSKVNCLLKGDINEKESALALLKDHEESFPNNVGLLCRLAEACYAIGSCDVEDAKKREFFLQGCDYAEKALKLDDTIAETHKWFAINVGCRSEYMGISEKIHDGCIFKRHVDKALNISPNDSALYHLSGRFKYEVASMSWIQQSFAKRFNSDFPTATYEDALADFLKAEELKDEPWKENRLFIAKCYINQNNVTNAIPWLQQAAKVPVTSSNDETVHQEILSLLVKYGEGIL